MVASQMAYSQYYVKNYSDSAHLEKTQVLLDLLSPGPSIEIALSQKKSFYADVTIMTESVDAYDTYFGHKSVLCVIPMINTQYRNYYNLISRWNQYRKISGNTANFIAFNVTYQFEPLTFGDEELVDTHSGFLLGPVWGLQRTGILSLNLYVGPGVYIYKKMETEAGFIWGIRMGLNLTKLLGKKDDSE